MISYIGEEIVEDYFQNVLEQSINPNLCAGSGLKIVYTPLNGTGNKPVRTILNRIGIQDVTIVKEQEQPDGNFTTCPYPNPEIREALQLGLQYCDQVKPDLLLATDPDADRVGIAVPDGNGGYALLRQRGWCHAAGISLRTTYGKGYYAGTPDSSKNHRYH